ncbi:hypothetical protein GCM10011506_01820 [Marivirga lumbricoides]|uniref:Uncharacterized protein n=1 Tax=Marivirga lumbricoides TaxID=1046115 RepID=A0ABQ1LBJ6_9BACT|nr:hypothetical protein GCM10011506_01820 [Marivirga lumbricoides]
MIVLKRIGIVLIVLITIQTITFYTIGESFLVKEIGSNYESYILQFEENEFKDIGVISELVLTKEKVLECFNEFEPYNLKICKSISDCSDLRETDFFYLYWFDFEYKNPFTINLINEGEFAKEYGAGWDSKYIWIIYKWVLIEKTNTGIS